MNIVFSFSYEKHQAAPRPFSKATISQPLSEYNSINISLTKHKYMNGANLMTIPIKNNKRKDKMLIIKQIHFIN